MTAPALSLQTSAADPLVAREAETSSAAGKIPPRENGRTMVLLEHDALAYRRIDVDAIGGASDRTHVAVRESLDEDRNVELIIEGKGLDVQAGDEHVYLRMRNRWSVRRLADAIRYAADRAEHLGLLTHLPAEDSPFQLPEDVPSEAERRIDRARGILNRRVAPFLPSTFDCNCDFCVNAQATPFLCHSCGFEGVPRVFACSCIPNWRAQWQEASQRVSRMRKLGLTELTSAVPGYTGEATTIDREVARLSTLVKRIPNVPGPCKAGPEGVEHRFDDCGHGDRECPVCGGSDNELTTPIVDPWKIIQELRYALEGKAALLPKDARLCLECADEVIPADAAPTVARCEPCVDRMMRRMKARRALREMSEGPFALITDLPPRESSPMPTDPAAVSALEAEVNWIRRVRGWAVEDQKRFKELQRINGIFAAARDRVLAGDPAWLPDNDYRRLRDDDGRRTLQQLHEEYIDALEDVGVIGWRDGGGVFLSGADGEWPEHGSAGVFSIDHNDGPAGAFDLVLGRRVNPKNGNYRTDMRVYVAPDVALQAEATAFLTQMANRYGTADAHIDEANEAGEHPTSRFLPNAAARDAAWHLFVGLAKARAMPQILKWREEATQLREQLGDAEGAADLERIADDVELFFAVELSDAGDINEVLAPAEAAAIPGAPANVAHSSTSNEVGNGATRQGDGDQG